MVSFKEAAVEVLKNAKEPLSAKEITEMATQEGLIQSEGKTPEASMGAIIYVDINNNKESQFIKAGKGRFGLKINKDYSSSPLFLIEEQNQNIKNTLKEKLHKMDPYQFEYFIADLLKEIGYENVIVTKRSGDGGIDVIADLTVGGITNVKTVIQVKRYRGNIPGKIITQLRGSAEVGQRGLVITTSDFTKDAISESKAQNKMPVSLVNGDKLMKLIFENEVGIKKENPSVYSIDNDYFQTETSTSKDSVISKDKNRSIWPLPGGTNSYVETLNQILRVISKGVNTKKDIIKWFIQNFENVKSERTAEGYLFVPKSMGLVGINNGEYHLTKEGEKYLENQDLEELYNIISDNIFVFEEIFEFIKNSEEPKSEKEILEYLKENFDIEWTSFAQTNFRILWLVNLNKIKKSPEGYLLFEDTLEEK